MKLQEKGDPEFEINVTDNVTYTAQWLADENNDKIPDERQIFVKYVSEDTTKGELTGETKKVTYDVKDEDGNPVIPKDELKDPKEGDKITDEDGNEYVIKEVGDPDPETGASDVTVVPITYNVTDENGDKVTPTEPLSDPKKGDVITGEDGYNYVVQEVGKPDKDTGVVEVTAKKVTYDVTDGDGNPINPKDELKDPKECDVITDEDGNEYVIKEVGEPDPKTGVAEATVVPVTYNVKDENGNGVTPNKPLSDPKKGDIITDEDGRQYVVQEVGKPDKDTGVAEVIAKKVTYDVTDEDGNPVKPKDELIQPKKGDVITDENGNKYVVQEVGDPDSEGISKVTVKKVTYDVTDGDGNPVKPKEELKDPKKGDIITDEDGNKWIVSGVSDPDENGRSKISVVKLTGGADIKDNKTGNLGSGKGSRAPQTGDDSNIQLWSMLSIISLLGICAAVFAVRRRRRNG